MFYVQGKYSEITNKAETQRIAVTLQEITFKNNLKQI